MLAYWPFLVAVLAGGAAAPDTADFASVQTARAERDFDLRRAELGLIGSAPFYGVEAPGATARRDFEARRRELGLIGSAPFYGMDGTVLAGRRVPASVKETAGAGLR